MRCLLGFSFLFLCASFALLCAARFSLCFALFSLGFVALAFSLLGLGLHLQVVERLALALAAVEVPFELDAVHPLWRALLLRQVVRVVVVNCATTHKISFKPVGAETTALSRKTAA